MKMSKLDCESDDPEENFDPLNIHGSLFNMKRMNFIDALRHAITDPGNFTRKMTFKNEFRYFKIHFCFQQPSTHISLQIYIIQL